MGYDWDCTRDNSTASGIKAGLWTIDCCLRDGRWADAFEHILLIEGWARKLLPPNENFLKEAQLFLNQKEDFRFLEVSDILYEASSMVIIDLSKTEELIHKALRLINLMKGGGTHDNESLG